MNLIASIAGLKSEHRAARCQDGGRGLSVRISFLWTLLDHEITKAKID